MKIKLLLIISFLLFLTGCFSRRESMGTYVLPTANIKEIVKEGKVCDDEEIFPFERNIDLTIETARKRGQITNIIAIEKEVKGNLIFHKTCTIVRGN